MEQTYHTYLHSIKKQITCSSVLKRKFLSDLESELRQFSEETNADYAQVVNHFGSPEQVAADFMDSLETEVLQNSGQRQKHIFLFIISVLCLLLFILSVIFYQFWVHSGDESKSEIITFVYPEEPAPDDWDSPDFDPVEKYLNPENLADKKATNIIVYSESE